MSAVIVSPEGAAIRSMVLAGPQEQSDQLPVLGRWSHYAEAYDAIEAALPRIDEATSPGPDGLIRIWLDRKFVARLGQMRGLAESYSEVILRLARP
jgi:hypothetical protein